MEDQTLKGHFDGVASGASFASYEERRWNANPKVAVQQAATEAFVRAHAVPCAHSARTITELGAGPGTWTKLLLEAAPSAAFTLVDISSEMLTRAKSIFPANVSVTTVEGDFATVVLPEASADFFFSSRAIEYVTPKEAALRTLMQHLKPGGSSVLITKMPKPLMNKLAHRAPSALHQNQITPATLRTLLASLGARDISFYPVTLSFPLLKSASVDRFLVRAFGGSQLSFISALFAESYGVTFKKP